MPAEFAEAKKRKLRMTRKMQDKNCKITVVRVAFTRFQKSIVSCCNKLIFLRKKTISFFDKS
jgi:hypothetical protein